MYIMYIMYTRKISFCAIDEVISSKLRTCTKIANDLISLNEMHAGTRFHLYFHRKNLSFSYMKNAVTRLYIETLIYLNGECIHIYKIFFSIKKILNKVGGSYLCL